jgi:hypothetical protein
MKRILVLNILLLAITSVFANDLVCKVTDGEEPMSYVSVYLKENPEIGTVSDLDGVFTIPDLQRNSTVVLSFVGYKTMELKFNKVPVDTFLVAMVEQPILLTEALIPSKEKKISKRKRMKQILSDVRKQMEKDFRQETRKYKVVSDYDVYDVYVDDKVIAKEEIIAQIAEIPRAGMKGTDSIQISIDVCKRYRNSGMQKRLDSLSNNLKDRRNLKLVQLTDSSRFIHRMFWGSDIKWLFTELQDKVSNWSIEEQDSTFLLTYKEKKNYLGIIKYEIELNYILDIYSYRVRSLSQSFIVKANIPFGYKLDEEQLSMINVVNYANYDMKKYRAKYVDVDIKRNIIYREEYGQVIPSEKNIDTRVELSERKQKQKIKVHQTGSVKVISAQTSMVKPLKLEEINKQFPIYETILE